MKAITLHQPWASLIAFRDKRIENRTWKPPGMILNQVIAIHAGMKVQKDLPEWLAPIVRLLPIPRGEIVCTARVIGYTTSSSDRYFAGPIGWLLADVKPCKKPVRIFGAQGLWNVPEDIVAQLPA